MSIRLIAPTSSQISLFSSARRHAILPRWSKRNVHVRRSLEYPIEGGLGKFLPPVALKALAVEYQDGLLERLSNEVRGTQVENMSVAKTVIETAPRREMALAFKYASEALNNSFFLDFLKPPPPPPAENHDHELSPYLGAAIRQFLGSVDQLKSRVSATADGMTSSGYVWLVTDQNGVLAVIPTYGAGTLLVRSRTQETPAEGLILGEGFKGIHTAEGPSNTVTTSSSSPSVTSPTSGTWRGIPPHEPSTPSRAFHTTHANHNSLFKNEPTSIYSMQSPFSTPPYSSRNENFDLSTLGETLYPLFCLSVHERSWLSAGYGIWGKEEWLKQFWTVLDWEKVSQAYVKFVPEPSIR